MASPSWWRRRPSCSSTSSAHKLFIDDHVNEPFPVAAPATSTSPAPAPTTMQTASTAALATDSPTTAPTVSLTTTPAGPVPERAGSFVSREHLGGLKGNLGDQNYEIPAELNLADYTSVVIWCDRFDAAFGRRRPHLT